MTKIELENKHLMESHELNRCRGNAVAFTLMAEMSKTEEARASNLGCVKYWDEQVAATKARIAALEDAIAEFNNPMDDVNYVGHPCHY
jgi:hypothetical protein